MGHRDQTNTWRQQRKAEEEVMLTWDEKVEKQPTATELGLKEEKKKEKKKEEGEEGWEFLL